MALEGNRLAQPTAAAAAAQDEAKRRRAWFAAAEEGEIVAMAALLEQQPKLIDATTRLQQGMNSAVSALQLCVWRNHCDAVAWLLDFGKANVELADEHGLTALLLDVVRVGVQQMRNSPLLDVVRVGVQQMRNSPLLRSRCIDVSSVIEVTKYKRKFVKDRSSFAEMDTRTLEALLARNAEVNHLSQIGESALQLAVSDGLIKQVRLLLNHGANVYHRDASNRTLLEVAGEYGFLDVAEALIARAPDLVPIAGEQAIREALCYDFAEIMELLLPQVIEPLAEDFRIQVSGQLLHLAVAYDAP
ncbi:hypothetical protein Gpo141_00014366, partial [Globisporangium polare]